jgi:hypothetical protein
MAFTSGSGQRLFSKAISRSSSGTFQLNSSFSTAAHL